MGGCRRSVISCGSPAWAGIDPGWGALDPIAPRFPRVGGDRPARSEFVARQYAVPPRGRG